MKFPCVIQQDPTDCAAACLASIVKYYGRNIGLATIRRYAKTDKFGTNGIGIIQASGLLGLKAEGYKIEDKRLKENPITYPIIAHVVMRNFNHYVVVYKLASGKVYLADPAEGLTTYDYEEFCSFWTGVVFTVIPEQEFYDQSNEKGALLKLIGIILRQKKYVVPIIFISVVYTILGLVSSLFFALLFDDLIPQNNVLRLSSIVLGFVVIGIFQMTAHFLRVKEIIKLERAFDADITLRTYLHIIQLPLSFFSRRQTGDILSRLNDTYKIRDILSGTSISVFVDLLMTVICGVALFGINKILFAATLFILLLYLLVSCYFTPKIKKAHHKAMEKNAELNANYVEMINGIETIKSFGTETQIKEHAENIFRSFMRSTSKCEKIQNNLGYITNSIQKIGYLCILWLGAVYVINATLTMGNLLAYYSLLGYFLSPVMRMIDLQISLQGAIVAFNRIEDINSSKVEDLSSGRMEVSCIDSINVHHLYFAYGNRPPVLNDISFSIEKGEHIAIVGESGCGKTTIAKLLMHFFDIDDGMIYANSIDINDISRESLRNRIAYVSQEPYFFHGSVRDNLLFGNQKDICDEQIIDCARQMQIDTFILSLPDGLDSHLQEGAKNISGGQKQRLALVRAFLRNPDLLILDEATSNLDAVTEKAIQETIDAYSGGMTTIIIAHRLSTIRRCDRIFVMEKGKIVGSGSHQELMARTNGRYWGLYAAQTGEAYEKDDH